jgi:glyoxylase-like metal-dependent hydrolase (beta-lactamase superfamily II)
MVCHCLLIEANEGLLLVDTGIGLADIADPRGRLGRWFRPVAHPRLDPAETAAHQVRRLGFRVEDVRHIVLTHLDLDHAGGLSDFPRARVHVLAAEHEAAMQRKTLLERRRYRPEQWAHGPDWVRYPAATGEPWFGFECVRSLDELPPEVLLVPLVGHSRGHCAVAVEVPGGWLLHAGDGYFFHGEMDEERPWCTVGLSLFQLIAQVDGQARRRNQERLRALAHGHREVQVFCAHDPHELAVYEVAGA